jgi:hypothetical protein
MSIPKGAKAMDNLEQRIRQGRLSRREFLELAGKGVGALAGLTALGTINQACKSNTDTHPPTTVTFTGTMRSLITGNAVSSGEITFNQTIKVPISSGVFNITPSHSLYEQTYDVRIETPTGYVRETNANLSNKGLFQTRTGLPIDNVIETSVDAGTYNNFLSYMGSQRWLTNRPKFFLYDKSLWSGKSGKLEVIDNNYQMNPTTIASVEYVVNNHIHLYTNNFAQGQLYKESNSSERPNPMDHPTGWIIYFDQDDAIFSITQGMVDNQGDIYFGVMCFQLLGAFAIEGISIDTAQTLGIGQQHNSGQILAGTEPSPLVTNFISKIIYNRAPKHTLEGGIDRE